MERADPIPDVKKEMLEGDFKVFKPLAEVMIVMCDTFNISDSLTRVCENCAERPDTINKQTKTSV